MLFISYAREDRREAATLVNELEAEGFACIIDPDLVEGDPFWREAIAAQLSHCRLMVCLRSAKADRSPWVEQEQRAFLGPKLHVALDQSRIAHNAVRPRHALRAIRAALSGRPRGPVRARRLTARLSKSDLRFRQIRRETERLAVFADVRARAPKAKLDVVGADALIRNGAVEVRLAGIRAGNSEPGTFIGLTPVTNGDYRAFVAATGYPCPPTWQRPEFCQNDAPVTGVTWFEAGAFAAWAGGGLPTEAEWIAAARGKDSGRGYATSTGAINHDVAHFGQLFARGAPLPAMAHAPTREGWYGLCGNTWDWCVSARGPHRVIRGGGWMDAAAFCTIGGSYRNAPIDRDCCVGFRIKVTCDDR
jgi:hypothetical protein